MTFKFESIGRSSTLSNWCINSANSSSPQTIILCMMVLQLVLQKWLKLRNHVWNWKDLEESGGDSSTALDFTNLEKSEAWVTTQNFRSYTLAYLFFLNNGCIWFTIHSCYSYAQDLEKNYTNSTKVLLPVTKGTTSHN